MPPVDIFSVWQQDRAQNHGAGEVGVPASASPHSLLHSHSNQPATARCGCGRGFRAVQLQSSLDGQWFALLAGSVTTTFHFILERSDS